MNIDLERLARHKDAAGCYAFFRHDVCLYVGKATRLPSRVKRHKMRFAEADKLTVWNLAKNIEGMDHANATAFLCLMEAYFITVLEPIENVKRPDFMSKLQAATKTSSARREAAELAFSNPPSFADL